MSAAPLLAQQPFENLRGIDSHIWVEPNRTFDALAPWNQFPGARRTVHPRRCAVGFEPWPDGIRNRVLRSIEVSAETIALWEQLSGTSVSTGGEAGIVGRALEDHDQTLRLGKLPSEVAQEVAPALTASLGVGTRHPRSRMASRSIDPQARKRARQSDGSADL